MNLAKAFARIAEREPNKTAVYWGDTEFPYHVLADQTAQVAAHLKNRLGVKPGDRVGLWLKNRPEFIPAIFGILQAGGVVVPINNFLKPAEVIFILNDAGADLIVSEADLAPAFPQLQSGRPALKCAQVEELVTETERLDANLTLRQESDLAVIIYTSGTTGRPKGAMLSHGNLLHNVDSCRLVLKCVENDRIVVLLPMFHSFMLCVGIFLPMTVGASIVLIRSVHPPRNVLIEICKHQATILPAIPQFFRSMVQAQITVPLPLRMAISGAAPLPGQVLKEFSEKFPFPCSKATA